MNRKVKRYDPISSDGTCGMCIEDADYGAYVEYEDFAAIEAECDALRAENDRLQRLQIALRLSSNRLDRLALEFPDASVMKWTASEWAVEARDALAASGDSHD